MEVYMGAWLCFVESKKAWSHQHQSLPFPRVLLQNLDLKVVFQIKMVSLQEKILPGITGLTYCIRHQLRAVTEILTL